MSVLRNLLLVVTVLVSLTTVSAQLEVGLMGGGSFYMGDLSPSSLEALNQTHASYGAYVGLTASDRFGAQVFFQSSKISGDDANRENSKHRNLSFRSNILEVGALAEFYVIGNDRFFSPYLAAGLSVYRFDPETLYEGSYRKLQPLGTEGQGIPGFGPKYSLTQLAVPFGVGTKLSIGQSLTVGLQFTARKIFTDYLDDVSGNYVNYYTLLEGRGVDGSNGNGGLAASLGDRRNEYLGIDEPLNVPSGDPRGRAQHVDWFYSGTLRIGYRLGSGAFSGQGNNSKYNRCYQF